MPVPADLVLRLSDLTWQTSYLEAETWLPGSPLLFKPAPAFLFVGFGGAFCLAWLAEAQLLKIMAVTFPAAGLARVGSAGGVVSKFLRDHNTGG